MSVVSVLLVGDTDRSEFRQARDALSGLCRVLAARDVEAAVAALSARDAIADLIVVAQSYPGEFSHQAIDRLRRLAPLARVLGLMGSWCEGEVRTGNPWPAAVRTYWHQWHPRCQQGLGPLGRHECSAWALPATASEEERLLWPSDARLPVRQGLIAIHTPLPEQHEWLAGAFRGRGYATVWLRPPDPAQVAGARAGIFDVCAGQAQAIEQLRRMCAAVGPTPVVALASFPRIEDDRALRAAGAAAVLSKPLRIEDLFWQVDALTLT